MVVVRGVVGGRCGHRLLSEGWGMPRCVECGTEIPPNIAICPECGALVDSDLRELMDKATKAFEEQFEVELEPTGYENEDEDRYEKEFWVRGLIESKVINIKVGGWFEVHEDGTAYCNLGILIDDKDICPGHGLIGYYDPDEGKWELSWESY